VNVGPTFDDPPGADTDATKIPKVITWISQNPHLPKPFERDDDPEETYRKTFLWIVPPDVFKGSITEPNPSPPKPAAPLPPGTPPPPIEWTPNPPDAPTDSLKFSGKFPTPSKPEGKDASELTAKEKKIFIEMFQKEKPTVNERTKEIYKKLPKMIDDLNAARKKRESKLPPMEPAKEHPPSPPVKSPPLPTPTPPPGPDDHPFL
jgi:hypothetical protein